MIKLLNLFIEHKKGILCATMLCLAFPACFPMALIAGGVGLGVSLWDDRDLYLSTQGAAIIGIYIGFIGGIASVLSLIFLHHLLQDFYFLSLTPTIQQRFNAALSEHGEILNRWISIHMLLSTISGSIGASATLYFIFPAQRIPNDI